MLHRALLPMPRWQGPVTLPYYRSKKVGPEGAGERERDPSVVLVVRAGGKVPTESRGQGT